jgi:hypothetical protein
VFITADLEDGFVRKLLEDFTRVLRPSTAMETGR